MPNAQTQSPLACDLTAISADERAEHVLTAKQLFQETTALRELENGYALRLPNDSGMVLGVARFIDHERECCPFFHFTLEIEAEGGPLWVHLAGREGVKDFLRAELGAQVKPDVIRAANLL